MRILVACEESQAVTIAFRERGHEAYSCDIQECSGGHSEWHIQGDVLNFLNPYVLFPGELPGIQFFTMDNEYHYFLGKWDMIIAHPPCTYLTVAGNRWYNVDRYGEKAIQRKKDRQEAVKFFMEFVSADCDRIAIENPVGYMSTHYRKPDCIIQPCEFGHPARKKTCLWLKNLPSLIPTDIVDPGEILPGGYSVGASANYATDENGKILSWNDPRNAKIRSRTFRGIARAMAEQWG